MRRALIAVVVVLATVACDGRQPSAPSGPATPTVVGLLVSAETVTVARNATTSITARVQWSNGTSEDVTAAATWTSSAPTVATVEAGTVRAVGVGAATVTVSYGSWSRTVAVVARRNTRLTGTLRVVDARGLYSIGRISAYLDTLVVYDRGISGGDASYTIPLGDPQRGDNNTNVEPGVVQLVIRLVCNSPFQGSITWASVADSYVDVRDRDTGESLARFQLPVKSATVTAGVSNSADLVWPLTIDVFR